MARMKTDQLVKTWKKNLKKDIEFSGICGHDRETDLRKTSVNDDRYCFFPVAQAGRMLKMPKNSPNTEVIHC